MQKLKDYWNERSNAQRMTLIGAFLAAFMAVGAFAWLANRTPLALLYGGLDAAQAGAVVAEIEKSGAAYEVRGDSIWVDTAQRDRMRMTLAGKGLPATGSAGYEILDGMSGFGTTSQMFDAAYWRAKEGELARTILALPNVKTARVHLAVPATQGYRQPSGGAASVTLTTDGGPIDRAQARALRFLVSSGVPGLAADRVTVIDAERGIVASADEAAPADRAAEMKRNVQQMLESRVGGGNAIVELNLDIVTESEQLVEQRFDPNERALISQESEETSGQSTNSDRGAVTASSNLPAGQDTQGGESRATNSENRQRANYEVSRVTRVIVRQPGATRRLSVAVLVNGMTQQNADGEPVVMPRPEPELQTLRELVASAVGFDEARGDVITVRSLPFAALSAEGTLAERAGMWARLDPNGLARLGLIGLFALLVAAVILRPMLRARAALPNGASAAAAGPALLDGSGAGAAPLPDLPLAPPAPEPELALPSLSMAVPEYEFVNASGSADPVARLRDLMRERKQESLQLLSGWIGDKEKA